jgi:predicted secreted protein
MTTAAKIGFGGSFQTGNAASPEVFTALGSVMSISGPSIAKDSIDATSFDSPSAWREFIMGLKDPGEISLELQITPAAMTTLLSQMNLTVVRNYRVVYPFSPALRWNLRGFMTGFECSAPLDDIMTASATFKLTEAPTLT